MNISKTSKICAVTAFSAASISFSMYGYGGLVTALAAGAYAKYNRPIGSLSLSAVSLILTTVVYNGAANYIEDNIETIDVITRDADLLPEFHINYKTPETIYTPRQP